jgi:hypothetical protein
MKYWLYLAAKLAAWWGAMYVLQTAVENLFPIPPRPWYGGEEQGMFMHDLPFTCAIFAVWLIAAGLFAIIVWDHWRRCRTCLRRLIMPVASGSWGNMVTFGRPHTELICPFGHGTLSREDLQITGAHIPDWQPHEDNIWKELESYYQARK